MKKIFNLLLALLIVQVAIAQDNIPVKIKEERRYIKEKLAKKGMEITFNDEKEEEDVHPFISKWTNKQLPALQLTDITGNTISSEDFEGKYVHINFWSTTCKPCIEEFPELDQLKAKYGDEDVIYLAIAPEVDTKVAKVLAKHPVNYRVVANAEALLDRLGVDGYPKNLFIDKDGTIRKAMDGSHYTIGSVDGEFKMTPDNFKYYDEVMKKLTDE